MAPGGGRHRATVPAPARTHTRVRGIKHRTCLHWTGASTAASSAPHAPPAAQQAARRAAHRAKSCCAGSRRTGAPRTSDPGARRHARARRGTPALTRAHRQAHRVAPCMCCAEACWRQRVAAWRCWRGVGASAGSPGSGQRAAWLRPPPAAATPPGPRPPPPRSPGAPPAMDHTREHNASAHRALSDKASVQAPLPPLACRRVFISMKKKLPPAAEGGASTSTMNSTVPARTVRHVTASAASPAVRGVLLPTRKMVQDPPTQDAPALR